MGEGRMGEGRVGDPGWLALLPPGGPVPPGAVPVATRDGTPAGHLLLAVGRARPVPSAVRIGRALVAAGGGDAPALAVSLVLPPPGARPLFDDPAVVHAMRAVLRDPDRAALVSTLVDGSTHWAGALCGVGQAVAAARPAWWAEDPFARLGPVHRLLVPGGALRPVPLPAGPGHQRHAGAPWPWGTFPGTP